MFFDNNIDPNGELGELLFRIPEREKEMRAKVFNFPEVTDAAREAHPFLREYCALKLAIAVDSLSDEHLLNLIDLDNLSEEYKAIYEHCHGDTCKWMFKGDFSQSFLYKLAEIRAIRLGLIKEDHLDKKAKPGA